MSNFNFKDNVPEFYTKTLAAGLDIIKKSAYASIEVEVPVHVLSDRYNLGGRDQVRKKIMELFNFLDAVAEVDGEEFSAVVHVKYVIERDALRIMYNEKMINKMIGLD